MLIGKKLKLRKVLDEDLKIIRDWRNSPRIWDFNTQYILLNMIHQNEWYRSISKKNSDRIMFMIEAKQRKLIGICGLIHIDSKNKNAGVAILIGEQKIHGKGYGGEALKLLLEYGFRKLKFHRISAEIFEYNSISVKLFKKLNFKYESTQKQSIWRRGRWWNVYLYSVLESEFLYLP